MCRGRDAAQICDGQQNICSASEEVQEEGEIKLEFAVLLPFHANGSVIVVVMMLEY